MSPPRSWFGKHCLPGTFTRRVLWTQLVCLISTSLVLTILDEFRTPCKMTTPGGQDGPAGPYPYYPDPGDGGGDASPSPTSAPLPGPSPSQSPDPSFGAGPTGPGSFHAPSPSPSPAYPAGVSAGGGPGLADPGPGPGFVCEDNIMRIFFQMKFFKAALVIVPAVLLCGLRYFEIIVDRVVSGHPDSIFRWLASRDSWTMASSKDVFEECANVLESSQDGVLLLTCVATLAVASLQTALQAASPALGVKGWPGAVDIYLNATCGEGWTPCRVAWVAMRPLMTLTGGAILYLQAVFLFIPRRAWSRVSLEAAAVVGDVRLQRLPAFFWSQLVFGPGVSIQGIYTNTRATTLSASREELLGFTAFSVTLFVAMMATIVWFSNIHLLPFRSGKRSARVGCVDEEADAVKDLWEDEPTEGGSRGSFLSGSREASKRYHQMVLVLLNIFMWCNDALDANRAYQSCTWLLRGGALLLLAMARDAPASFRDLSGGRAGFGLVVDTHELASVIDAYLTGQPRTVDSVRRYKASMLRMQETLAVSYRWQAETVHLCSDCRVNMSRWQLEQLLLELRTCNCAYVWIDHLSVPQSDGHAAVQATLLARMMAVYASAGLTLALRSLELEKNRYHQRGWTLQEYANASALVVVTQEATGDGDGDDSISLEAVRADEEELAKSIRRQVVSKAADRRPLWLYTDTESITNSLSESEVREKDQLYARLRSCQYTADPADLVRALYPLVYDRPAESPEELLQLVRSAALRMNSFGTASRASADLALLMAAAEAIAEASVRFYGSTGSVRMRYIRTQDGEPASLMAGRGPVNVNEENTEAEISEPPLGSAWMLNSLPSIM